jgi:integrating conjugative element membrane protein (TIGR03745 family)
MVEDSTYPNKAGQALAVPRQPLRALWHRSGILLMGLLISGERAMAALPTTAEPSRGAEDGNYIKLMQDYAYDIFIFIGLAVATLAFFAVSKNTIGAYGEVQDGKGTWGQLGINFGAGVLLLVFVVFLLTEAAAIL